MKAKVLVRFIDKHTGEVHKKDDVIDITEKRFKEILETGNFVEKVKAEKKAKTEEPVAEETTDEAVAE